MIRGMGYGRRAVIIGAAFACALCLVTAPAVAQTTAPHVATTTTPDTCSMCHRAHSASADFGRIDPDSWEMTSTALALAVPLDAGDTALCYVCHGVDALGSGTPVGGAFAQESVHTLAPVESPYGPSVKYCSSCHDSHGADKRADASSYPVLLRARTEDGVSVFGGSAYCITCHEVREESSFDGVDIYEQTTHFTLIPDPANGTKIRCSVCHTAHGSAVAPLIVSEVTPPAVDAAVPVTANDRTLCFVCHEDERGGYPGREVYELSAHAVSDITAPIPGEWPVEDATRLIGECQYCHAVMGRDDGAGVPIPALLEVEADELCLPCHDADGPATTDLASLAYPDTSANDLELVAAFTPDTTTAFGTVAVWGTEAEAVAPRQVVGPRFYAAEGTSGVMAVGDIDGDGAQNVVVADRDFGQLTVFSPDRLKGLSSYFRPGVLVIDEIADHIVVADVFDNGQLEVCVIAGSTLYVYRYDDGLGMLQPLATLPGLGTDITGIAAGDVTGDGFDELVITDAGEPQVRVVTQAGVGVTLLYTITGGTVRAGVRGPSVGDVLSTAGVEIAVANADTASNNVTIYDGATGAFHSDYTINAPAGIRAWTTLIADVLPGVTTVGTSGLELAVAGNGGSGLSAAYVYTQTGTGALNAPQRYDTGTGYGTGSLAVGDIDGDAWPEFVVGNGGFWSRDAALATPPNVQVLSLNAAQSAFDTALTLTLPAGGVERAGEAPALAVVDLGGVGPSRHPVGAVEDQHEYTEATPLVRHVECMDCHNVHETTSTVSPAPAAYGRVSGTFGATAALADAKPITYEYELCYKCHSAYQAPAGLEGATDISALLDSANASVHAVEESVATTINVQTFEDDWDNDSVLFCIDCHSVAGAAPAIDGPHVSSEAPILRSPYLGVTPANPNGLCYDCHKYAVYYTGGANDPDLITGSFFRDATAGALHELHVGQHGFGCAACHASHGEPTNERLVRGGIEYDATARTCTGPCHPGGIAYTP